MRSSDRKFASRPYSIAAALAFGLLSGLGVAHADHHKDKAHDHHKGKNLVETAKAAGQFNTLLKAATAAELVDTLKGDQPLTVFAPTDKAFAKLPDGVLDSLLDNKQALREVLLLHVVPGKQMAGKVVKADRLGTAYGQPVYINADDHGVKVNNASVLKTDVKASNGVIHVVDEVILPKTIAQLVVADDRFSKLEAAVKAAGLVETLNGDGPFTVFAPIDKAFAKLPDGALADLLKPANRQKLNGVLTYHVAAGAVPAEKVVAMDEVKTLQGQSVPVEVVKKTKDGKSMTHVHIGGARVILADVRATNGVIHVINNVLMP